MLRLILTLFVVMFSSPAVLAEEPGRGFRPEDRVTFDVSAEDWVTTKTAHASIAVEAAVNAANAGTTRADMTKAVNGVAQANWRLTSFDRIQDQTGMERWSAIFEARLPEAELAGIAESAKKQSKTGMQLTVANIDFSPTLDEMETARAGLRAQIYKTANEQLAALNANMPGRTYRVALVDFTGDDSIVGVAVSPMPRVIKGQAAMNMINAGIQPPPPASSPAPVERSEKVALTARIVYAATDGKAGTAQTVSPLPLH